MRVSLVHVHINIKTGESNDTLSQLFVWQLLNKLAFWLELAW